MVKKQSILNDKPSTVMGYPLTIQQQICLCFLLPSIINCIIYILDISTCVSAVREHFDAGLHVWAVFTIILLYLPSVVFFVLTVSKPDLWDEQGDIVRTGQWFMFRLAQLVAFPIWAIYRYAKQLFWSIEALIREDPLREEALQEVIEPSQIELYLYLQAFIQCAPQAVLQIFIMLYAYTLGIQISSTQVLLVMTSLTIMASTTTCFQRFESQRLNGRIEPWKRRPMIDSDTNATETTIPTTQTETKPNDTNVDTTKINYFSPSSANKPLLLTPTPSFCGATLPLKPTGRSKRSFRHSAGLSLALPNFPAPPRPSSAPVTAINRSSVLELPGRKKLVKGLEEDEPLGKNIAYFWWFFYLLSRTLSIATFAHFHLSAAIGVVLFHYGIMAAYLLYQSRFPSIYKSSARKSIVSDTPPVKSTRASHRWPPSKDSYEPCSLRHIPVQRCIQGDKTYSLGVSFLDERCPELIITARLSEEQLVVHCRQEVIYHYIHPVPKPPESEVEDARVLAFLFLVPLLVPEVWNNLCSKHSLPRRRSSNEQLQLGTELSIGTEKLIWRRDQAQKMSKLRNQWKESGKPFWKKPRYTQTRFEPQSPRICNLVQQKSSVLDPTATEAERNCKRATEVLEPKQGAPPKTGSLQVAAKSGMGEGGWKPFVYGGLASCTAEFGTFPIDTTKTRLQIQGQKTDGKYAELKYRGMTHALLQISKQEGVRALYSGIGPAVLRQATYGTIKFGTYYSLKHLTVKANGEEDVALNVCCAVVAGMVSSAIANPTDVLKVRMQVLGTQSSRGIVGCFQEVYHHEGVAGLWREVYYHEKVAGLWKERERINILKLTDPVSTVFQGVGPTSQRAAVIAAVELPVYDFCKQHLMTTFGDRVSNHFISSFIASLGSAVASTPIDVVRTRLMNQRKLKTTSGGASTLHIYSGSVDCLAQTVKNEGLLALYKGFIPTWVRMGPWNIIFFVTYEQLKKFY
uniref:XK-related protein n=1 Tax=Timema tahoe TaxID=61484 RepID=A0A7R9FMY7_9NEOP|nr:unnamed protein product [Timema tahoe]